MRLFHKKRSEYPKFPEGNFQPVLRCSICNGEQVLCARDMETGQIKEIMLIRSPDELDAFCEENGLTASEIEKVY